METQELKYVGFDGVDIKSTLTAHTVRLNTTERFSVISPFAPGRLRDAKADWTAFIQKFRAKSREFKAATSDTLACANACFMSVDAIALASAVDALVARTAQPLRASATFLNAGGLKTARRKRKSNGQDARVTAALTFLWKHHLLLFPAAELWTPRLVVTYAIPPITKEFFGPAAAFLSVMDTNLRWTQQRRSVKMLPLCLGPLKEPGDIDVQAIRALVPFAPRPYSSTVYGVLDQLLLAQQRSFAKSPVKLARLPQSYRAEFKARRAPRSDGDFAWANDKGGSRVAAWTRDIAAHLRAKTNRVGLRYEVQIFNTLLDYVIASTDVADSPIEYCRRTCIPRRSFAVYMEQSEKNQTGVSGTMRVVARFFEWVIATHGSDENGAPRREFRQPIDEGDIPTQLPSKGQTHRNALPVRFLRLLREIIESPDANGQPTYAWPKTLAADHFFWTNPDTGVRERTWSPVRANLFLLRLMLPIRGLQARLLDSGEADDEVFRPTQGGWQKNTGRLAPADSTQKPTGLMRRIWDHERGCYFNGLYITTNKTADRAEMFTDSGYEIPWENQDIVELFCRVRDWQERYNPCIRLLTRADIRSDAKLLVSPDVAARLDKLCFLFRDAADPTYPQEPPTDGRLVVFWRELVDELEQRLARTGLTNQDGSRIVLIDTRTETGEPRGTVFDIHSLRVSGLTALAGAGVPIHILSQFVAGHASVLMTLYYQKPGAAKITESLDEAWQKLAELEGRDWDLYLKSQPLELLHDIAVYNDEASLADAKATQSALWATMDDGICPNGATRCSVGGPVINKGKNAYAPVPGGARNCPMCRFFVTGTAFLAGLVAKYNARGGHLREILHRLQEKETARRSLEACAMTAERQGVPFAEQRRLNIAEEAVDGVQRELEVQYESWIRQLTLIKRVEKILQQRTALPAGAPDALVLNGSLADFHVALEECTEFDLWDRICQSTVFYPSIDAQVPALRRAKLFDAMFSREQRGSVFASLNDQQLVAVGNAAARFLRHRLGDAVANDVIAGTRTLAALGIEKELDEIIRNTVGAPLTVDTHRLGSTTSQRLLPTTTGEVQ